MIMGWCWIGHPNRFLFCCQIWAKGPLGGVQIFSGCDAGNVGVFVGVGVVDGVGVFRGVFVETGAKVAVGSGRGLSLGVGGDDWEVVSVTNSGSSVGGAVGLLSHAVGNTISKIIVNHNIHLIFQSDRRSFLWMKMGIFLTFDWPKLCL